MIDNTQLTKGVCKSERKDWCKSVFFILFKGGDIMNEKNRLLSKGLSERKGLYTRARIDTRNIFDRRETKQAGDNWVKDLISQENKDVVKRNNRQQKRKF